MNQPNDNAEPAPNDRPSMSATGDAQIPASPPLAEAKGILSPRTSGPPPIPAIAPGTSVTTAVPGQAGAVHPPPPPPAAPVRSSFRVPHWAIFSGLGVVALLAVAVVVISIVILRRIAPLPPRVPELVEEKHSQTSIAFGTPFGAPVTGGLPPADVDAIRGIFVKLHRACAAADTVALDGIFDADRMTRELERLPNMPKLPFKERRDFVKRLGGSYLNGVAGNDIFHDEGEVKRVISIDTPNDAAVFVRFAGERETRMRFWVHKSSDGRWRFYDMESLENPSRSTTHISSFWPMSSAQHKAALEQNDLVNQTEVALNGGKLDEAERLLSTVRPDAAPDVTRLLYHLYRARLLLKRDKPREALLACDAADAIARDAPLVLIQRAVALQQLDDHEQAIRVLRKEIDQVGPSANNAQLMLKSLEMLDREEEAIPFLRASIEASAAVNIDNLVALARLLPPEQKAEIGRHFEKSPFTQETYRSICSNLTKSPRTGAALKAVVDVYERTGGAATDVAFYRGVALDREKKHDEAMAIFRSLLKTKDPYYVSAVPSYFVSSTIELGRPLEGYEGTTDRVDALESVMTALLDVDRAAARALVDRHIAEIPQDGNGWYWKAHLLVGDKKREEADAFYVKALELDIQKKFRHTLEDDFARNRFHIGQGISAYEALPGEKRFDQLAMLYYHNSDAEGLSELIRAHAAKSPADPVLPAWRGQVHFLRAEYAKAADLYRAYLKVNPDRQRYRAARSQLVRSHVRLGQPDAALAAATDVPNPYLYNLLLANAALGKVDECISVARKYCDYYEEDSEEFYADADLAGPINSPAFARFREAFPRPTATDESVETPATQPSLTPR